MKVACAVISCKYTRPSQFLSVEFAVYRFATTYICIYAHSTDYWNKNSFWIAIPTLSHRLPARKLETYEPGPQI